MGAHARIKIAAVTASIVSFFCSSSKFMSTTRAALRVIARTTDSPDIEIDDARRRLLRAEATGVEEALDDVLVRMRERIAEFEEDRALVTRLVERLVALRDAECGVTRILHMRKGE